MTLMVSFQKTPNTDASFVLKVILVTVPAFVIVWFRKKLLSVNVDEQYGLGMGVDLYLRLLNISKMESEYICSTLVILMCFRKS